MLDPKVISPLEVGKTKKRKLYPKSPLGGFGGTEAFGLPRAGFEFLFRIALHKDDRKTLEYIQSKLDCGVIRVDRNNYVLIISNFQDIEFKLLPVFEEFHLNSSQ